MVSSRYEIVVAGEAGPMVLAAVDGFAVRPSPSGSVRLVGSVADQAALQGVLHRLDDLHAEILEVRRLSGKADDGTNGSS
jgi:hypothetical protein